MTGNANEKRDGGRPPLVHEHEIRAELGELFQIVELHEYRLTSNQVAGQDWLRRLFL